MSKKADIVKTKDESVVLYSSADNAVQLDVQLSNDTVWLTANQMALLFDKEESNIRRHIINIFKEKELERENNVRFLHVNGVKKPVPFYSIDVIISVGYLVKSKRGIQFRQWANRVLREYLLRGYALNQHLKYMEQRIDNKLQEHSEQIHELQNKVDFFVRTSLPPREGVLYDGQIFDAYEIASRIIKSATKRIVLIDNYVDESVLMLLEKRAKGVETVIYTKAITAGLQQDIDKHNAQYAPIEVKEFAQSHDRFWCIDETVYHIGASLKDLGKKWFAFSRMEINAETLLEKLK